MKRILIGGTNSGCGKTTVTCALLGALKNAGLNVSPFKCGPDYIDPMFYSKITGSTARNLDSFFCNDEMLRYIFYDGSQNTDISVIEGVMGYYDGSGTNGISGTNSVSGTNTVSAGSAHSVSLVTDTPAVIVINCTGMSDSIGAVMRGFLEYRKPNNIIGFIFNRLPEKLTQKVKGLCAELGTGYFGYMPRHDIIFNSRHLGLLTADEIGGLDRKIAALSELAAKHILIDKLLEACERSAHTYRPPVLNIISGKKPLIAVSKDKAFCFEYEENILLLKRLGCEIKYFSPLDDKTLPENIDGLILCGGYPELYARKLGENFSMRESVRSAVKSGLPTIAECGGFMYLHEFIEDENFHAYPAAGVINARAFKTQKLNRFGYIKMTAKHDNLLCKAGETISAHEYHYWDSTAPGSDFCAQKPDGRQWECAYADKNIYAGFPHLYFYSDVRIAENFVKKCAERCFSTTKVLPQIN